MERFAKFFSVMVCLLVTAGCSTVQIPKYIKDQHPYQEEYYDSFQATLDATNKALSDFGWQVTETAEPSMFERSKAVVDPDTKQILLFTEIRQTGLFLGSRYQRLNVILQSARDDQTNVELRYVTVSSVPFKTFTSYKKDSVAKKIFERIGHYLAQ